MFFRFFLGILIFLMFSVSNIFALALGPEQRGMAISAQEPATAAATVFRTLEDLKKEKKEDSEEQTEEQIEQELRQYIPQRGAIDRRGLMEYLTQKGFMLRNIAGSHIVMGAEDGHVALTNNMSNITLMKILRERLRNRDEGSQATEKREIKDKKPKEEDEDGEEDEYLEEKDDEKKIKRKESYLRRQLIMQNKARERLRAEDREFARESLEMSRSRTGLSHEEAETLFINLMRDFDRLKEIKIDEDSLPVFKRQAVEIIKKVKRLSALDANISDTVWSLKFEIELFLLSKISEITSIIRLPKKNKLNFYTNVLEFAMFIKNISEESEFPIISHVLFQTYNNIAWVYIFLGELYFNIEKFYEMGDSLESGSNAYFNAHPLVENMDKTIGYFNEAKRYNLMALKNLEELGVEFSGYQLRIQQCKNEIELNLVITKLAYAERFYLEAGLKMHAMVELKNKRRLTNSTALRAKEETKELLNKSQAFLDALEPVIASVVIERECDETIKYTFFKIKVHFKNVLANWLTMLPFTTAEAEDMVVDGSNLINMQKAIDLYNEILMDIKISREVYHENFDATQIIYGLIPALMIFEKNQIKKHKPYLMAKIEELLNYIKENKINLKNKNQIFRLSNLSFKLIFLYIVYKDPNDPNLKDKIQTAFISSIKYGEIAERNVSHVKDCFRLFLRNPDEFIQKVRPIVNEQGDVSVPQFFDCLTLTRHFLFPTIDAAFVGSNFVAPEIIERSQDVKPLFLENFFNENQETIREYEIRVVEGLDTILQNVNLGSRKIILINKGYLDFAMAHFDQGGKVALKSRIKNEIYEIEKTMPVPMIDPQKARNQSDAYVFSLGDLTRQEIQQLIDFDESWLGFVKENKPDYNHVQLRAFEDFIKLEKQLLSHMQGEKFATIEMGTIPPTEQIEIALKEEILSTFETMRSA